jgi:hypothetical protein
MRSQLRGQRRKRITSEWRQALIVMISKYIDERSENARRGDQTKLRRCTQSLEI